MSRNRMTKAKARAKPRQNPNRGSEDPPQFAMQPTFHRKMRFLNALTENLQTHITSGDILAALGTMSTGGGAGFEGFTIASSLRIKKVEIWAAPKSDTDGAWQSAFLEWKNSTSFSKSTRVQDASISNARPLHIASKPPPLSVCDLWVHGPSVELFHLKVPVGAIIDVTCDFLMCDINEPIQITLPETHSAGKMIYENLDRTTTNALVQIDRDL